MDDLISRAALLKECAECQKTDPHFEERGWVNHFIDSAGEPSTEWYCIEDMIENAPAIAAIPVQWIEGRLNVMLKGASSAASCFVVMLLLADWESEQEVANDGKDA